MNMEKDEQRRRRRLGPLMDTLRDGEVPDPGEAYWKAFPDRVRQAVETEPRSLWTGWRLWGGLAAAAAVLALFVVRTNLTTSPAQVPGSGPVIATGPGPQTTAAGPDGSSLQADVVGGTLDSLLGDLDPFQLVEGVREWSPEEREELLQSLQDELETTAGVISTLGSSYRVKGAPC